MKILPLLGVISMLAAPLTASAQTTIFNDTFNNGSTLNGTSTPGGTATASSTSYDAASTKTGSCTVSGTSGLRVKLSSATTGGYLELQAKFASTPVQLVNVGDSINLTIVFTNSAGSLMVGGNKSGIYVGLFNSGATTPVAGGLNAAGLATGLSTFTSGNCQNWQGYVSTVQSNTFNTRIYTRPFQTAANNANQDLLFSGAGGGLYTTPAGTQIGANVTVGPTLVNGAKYTNTFTILLSAVGTVSITNNLYDASGTLLSSVGGTTGAANTYTNFANNYDGLAIGIANSGTSFNPQMDISQITITTNYYFSPTIANLTNRTVIAGTSPTLSPTITGNPSAAYQWQTNGVNIGGATSGTLTLNNVQYAQNTWVYSLIATNVAGSVTNSMTLSVIVTPTITGLNNQSANVGDTVSISPTVTGVPTPSYQWRFNGTNLTDGLAGNGSTISGSTTASLSVANAQVSNGGSYSLVASNSAGIVTNSMSLTVAAGSQAPVITGPTNITVIQGNTGTFSASATGVPVPTLQWLDQNQAPILNATNSTLVLTNVQYSQNGYAYSLVASNTAGVVTNSATLTVYVPPAISVHPASLVVTNTQSATFTVTASGVPALAYQWYFGSNAISGATSFSYNIASAAAANIGNYFVIITNAAGSVTSSVASLVVNSTMSATAFSPSNGATGICYDTPLTVTFSSAPTLGSIGTIKIYNVTNSVTPVDTITIASGAVQSRNFPGDGQAFAYQTIQISGNTAKIYPHFSVLSSNATYYVTIDNGAFTDASGAYFAGITATNTWQFATKVGGPVNSTNPVVNADGSADFLTVQGAINSLPAGTNATQRVISIRNGLYNEIVDITGKHNVTLRGQSRSGAVIYFPNNNTYQTPVNGGTTHARMTFKLNANDIVLDSLTVSNSTPQGGSQAEALMIESGAKRCIVYNSEIDSRQDTILGNQNSSQTYFYQSIIKGNFDYIWGGGNFFFDQCEIRTISGTAGANFSAARTDTSATQGVSFPWLNPGGTYSANGMSFVSCTFTAESGAGAVTLAGSNGTAGNNVSWYGCDFATNYVAPSASLFSGNYLFWQNSNTMTNAPVTFAVLTTIGVTNNDPRLLAATNIPTWFYGWSPSFAPYILTQPTNQTANVSNNVSFVVTATALPNPTYQWFKGATPISGATGATLTLTNVQFSNAGSYSVVVSNAAGTATSTSATLTIPDRTPVAATMTVTRTAGLSLHIALSDVATNWSDADGDTVTLAGINLTTTNGVILLTNSTLIYYTNSPNVNDQISYTISDGQGGTNIGYVNIVINNSVTGTNSIVGITTGGTNVVTAYGIPAYSYILERATNLAPAVWISVSTNAAAGNGLINATDNFNDLGNTPPGAAYYRLKWQP